jgi:hypothetical protein
MMDGKPALRGVSPQPMFDRRLLDLVVCGEWLLRSSKPYMAMAFAGVPIHYCQCSFQYPDDKEQANEDGGQYAFLCIFICYWSFLRLVVCCLYYPLFSLRYIR